MTISETAVAEYTHAPFSLGSLHWMGACLYRLPTSSSTARHTRSSYRTAQEQGRMSSHEPFDREGTVWY